MSEADTIHKTRIKHRGLFDFKDVYEFGQGWFMDENYDVFERKYVEKLKGDSKDLEVKWECMKEISDYFRYVIIVEIVVLGIKSVEVQKGNKKIKMDSGLIEIRIKGNLVKDYENRWENHPFWKFLRGFYDRYLIRTRVEYYEERLMEEVIDFSTQLKSFLGIETKKED